MSKVSPLRQRTLDLLTLGHYAPRTIDSYIQWIERLAMHYRLSPEKLTPEQVQDFLLYLIEQQKLAWSTVNQAMAAYRFFYRHVMDRSDYLLKVPARRKVTRRAFAYSKEEVWRIIHATGSPKYKAIFLMVYGSGLRVCEVVRLRAVDIESERGLVRINQSKGNKDRYTILSKRALEQLRIYYRIFRPEEWLFFGRDHRKPLSIGSAQKMFTLARNRAGISKGSIHTLRHSFATHMVDNDVDIYELKRLMGHTSVKTTYGYIHVSQEALLSTPSPLDLLYAKD